jgi:hypothetical protein
MSIYTDRNHDWSKPAVYKISKGGMWWATVKDVDGRYHSECYHRYEDAVEQANAYAVMVKAHRALKEAAL